MEFLDQADVRLDQLFLEVESPNVGAEFPPQTVVHHVLLGALVEATVGGLLTGAFAGRSGASRYFRQSRFAYDEAAKRGLIGEARMPSAVSDGMVLALARGMREQGGTDFALAESGMAGPPDGRRRSFKNGLVHIALVTPKGEHSHQAQFNPFLTRREHQHLFSIEALTRMEEWLTRDGY